MFTDALFGYISEPYRGTLVCSCRFVDPSTVKLVVSRRLGNISMEIDFDNLVSEILCAVWDFFHLFKGSNHQNQDNVFMPDQCVNFYVYTLSIDNTLISILISN